MKGLVDFVGALAFLFCMLLAGVAAGAALFKLAEGLGASDEAMRWLLVPIALGAVVACYFAGKLAHRGISRLI